MKQSKFSSDASHLTCIGKWDHWWGEWSYYPVFYNAFAHSNQAVETLQNADTQTRRDDLLFPSITICRSFRKQDDIFL